MSKKVKQQNGENGIADPGFYYRKSNSSFKQMVSNKWGVTKYEINKDAKQIKFDFKKDIWSG